MRIVVLSTFFKASVSYSLLTAALMRRLAELPEVGGRQNVCHVGSNVEGPPCTIEGFPVFPLDTHGLGREGADMRVIARAVLDYAPDLVIVIHDARMAQGLVEECAPVPVWFWMPVDSDPVSPLDLQAIKGAKAIAMSRFGLEQLARAGVENRAYIPAPLDSAFCVDDDKQLRAKVRAQMGGQGCEHLTLIVGRYVVGPRPDRKAYAQALRAWAEFAADKSGARLFCHVWNEGDGRTDGQIGVHMIAHSLGLAGRVRYPSNVTAECGASLEQMAQQYNGADALLHATAAEGFGLPIVEAQACGTPVVCTGFTSMPELVRWGLAVKPLDVQWVHLVRSWLAWPDVHGTAAALQALYDEWQAAGGRWPLARRRSVSAAVREEYGWDQVFDRCWTPLVQNLVNDKAHSYSP